MALLQPNAPFHLLEKASLLYSTRGLAKECFKIYLRPFNKVIKYRYNMGIISIMKHAWTFLSKEVISSDRWWETWNKWPGKVHVSLPTLPDALYSLTTFCKNHLLHELLWTHFLMTEAESVQKQSLAEEILPGHKCVYAALAVPVQRHGQPLTSPFTCSFPLLMRFSFSVYLHPHHQYFQSVWTHLFASFCCCCSTATHV